MYITKYLVEHFNDNTKMLINTLTGVILNLSKDDYAAYNILKTNIEYCCDLKARLISKKIIFMNSADEKNLIKKIKDDIEKYSIEEEYTIYVIYITYDCNIKCNYCCYNYLKYKTEVISCNSMDLIFSAIKELQEKSKRKKYRICLFGGEPLMKKNINIIHAFFEKAQKHIQDESVMERLCELMIFTNAIELPSFAEILLKNKNIINKILITLLGNEYVNDQRRKHFDGSGTFHEVIKGIEVALKIGIPVWTVTNIDKNNIDEIPNIVALVKQKGWHNNEFFSGYYVGRIKYYKNVNNTAISESELLFKAAEFIRNDEVAAKILNFGDMRNLKSVLHLVNKDVKYFQKFYACASGNLQQYSFGSDNLIYTCSGAMGIKEYSIGEYFPSFKLNERKIHFWIDRDVLSINKCMQCKCAFLCGGGCSYAAKMLNGSIMEPYCADIETLLHIYIECKQQGINIKYKDLLRD
jgi:uncharacterized protein